MERKEKDIQLIFSANLSKLLKEKSATQVELAKFIGVSNTTINNYVKGYNMPRMDKVDGICRFFNISRSELIDIKENKVDNKDFEFVDLSNSVNIPVVGTIPAGFAMEAVENILGYIDIPADWTKGGKEYVGLKVSGDSMYPLFLDGDTVVIQLQNTAENGDICACYVNGFDATLKRIKLTNNSITLQPENPNYPPTTYTHPGEVTIAGKVVEVRRKF